MKTITQTRAKRTRLWLLYMLAVLVAWGGKVSAQTTYTIGTGTSSSSYLPIYSCYGYNYSQVIYLASELNTAGLTGPSFITKIRYKSVSPVSNSTWSQWDVYMGNTTTSSFASTSSWIPSGNMTQVFSGTITQPVAGQWMEITLANPFFWDGSSNIVVGVDENTPSYTCTATWQSTSVSGTRALLFYNDVTNPAPSAPPTANYSTASIANIQFDAAPAPACSGTPTGGTAVATPAAPCFNATASIAVNGATLATGLTYSWESSSNGGTTWVPTGTTSATFTTPPVSSSIMYRRKIKCGANDSAYSSTVTVAAAVNLPPYSETFESITANNQLPTCMSATNVGSIVYTYTANQTSYNRINHTPGGSKFASYRYGCNDYIYTPAIQLTGGQLYQFSYWYITDGLGGWNTIQAAYGTSPTSGAQTNVIGTVTSPSNSAYQQAIYTFTPATTGTYYLSIYCQSTFSPWYLTIDDINLVALPPCSGAPTAGTVTPAGPVTGCPGTQYTFTTNGTTTAANLTYQWLQSTNANPAWTAAAGTGANSLFFTTPNLTDTIRYRMVVTCTNSGLRDSSTIVTVNVPKIPYAAIPYTEDFESWISRCGTTDAPSASWTNVPFTGNSAWRRNDQGSSASWTSATTGMNAPFAAVGTYSARWHGYYAPAGNNGAGTMDLFVNCGTITGNKELQFYYKTQTGTPYPNDSLKILLSTNGGATFTQIGAYGPNTGNWELKVLPIVSNSATTVVRFVAKDDYQYYGDIGLDYVRILPPCSGKPTAGNVKPITPCPNSDFQLTLQNSTQAAGLTYQWQSSPDGVTWSNTTYMTNATQAIAIGNVPGPYYFRCIVTCTNSSTNNVDTTAPYYVQMAPFYVCYCQSGSNPSYYNYGNVGNFKVTTQPANVTLLNNGTASPLTYNSTAIANYTSFTNLPPVPMYRDSLYQFSVTEISQTYFVTGTNYGAVYLDYDRNGNYDAYERIVYKNITNTSTQQIADTFRIPDTASVGITGMRVIVYPYYSTINPCGTNYYGETEDYLAEIKYPPCDGPTNAGIAFASDTAMCPGYAFTVIDTTHEKQRSGITWKWQTSTNNGGSWTDVANSVNKDTITQTFSNTAWYRLRMFCTVTGDSTFSNTVQISIKPPYKCYCYSMAVGGKNDTSDIGAMSIGNFIVNSGGPHLRNPVATKGRTDYTDLGPIELYADTTYEVDVYHTMPNGTHSDARVTLFMDFNNNLQYDIPQERVDIMPASTNNWMSTVNNWYLVNHITIPTAVIPDVPTGMRVIINNNVGPNTPSDNACGAYTSGETEDYVVVFRKGFKTSVGEIANLKDLALFPNPTTGRFSISFTANTAVKDLQINITNMTGQQIMQQEYKNAGNSFVKELDLGNVARGVYFVEIKADGEKTIRKIVVR